MYFHGQKTGSGPKRPRVTARASAVRSSEFASPRNTSGKASAFPPTLSTLPKLLHCTPCFVPHASEWLDPKRVCSLAPLPQTSPPPLHPSRRATTLLTRPSQVVTAAGKKLGAAERDRIAAEGANNETSVGRIVQERNVTMGEARPRALRHAHGRGAGGFRFVLRCVRGGGESDERAGGERPGVRGPASSR